MKPPPMKPSIPSQEQSLPPAAPLVPRAWWQEPYVWMVISGPVSVVLACIVTAFYILQGPDAVVAEDTYREGQVISKTLESAAPPMQAAQTGRNHSATGGKTYAK